MLHDCIYTVQSTIYFMLQFDYFYVILCLVISVFVVVFFFSDKLYT